MALERPATATRRMLQVTMLSAIMASVACAAGTETSSMESEASGALERATAAISADVHDTLGWSASEYGIRPLADLSVAGCSLYAVGRNSIPDAEPVVYGVLADGSLASSRQEDGLGRLLRECGNGQPAEWWARVVSMFKVSPSARVVLGDSPLHVGLVTATGQEFSAPELVSGRGGTKLRFFAIVRATQPVRVDLRMEGAGEPDVTVTPLSSR